MPELPQQTLSPSDLGGAKALPGEAGQDQDAAKRRGRQVHQLLEILPKLPAPERQRAAEVMLSGGADAAAGAELVSVMAEVTAVLDAPALASLFAADALAEVPVSAALPTLGGQRIHGVIDRLIIGDREVLAVDFKSNGVVPTTPDAVPEGFLRQMGAYAEALGLIYPAHEIRVALLWTRTATLMPLTHEHVIAALRRAAIP